MHYKRHRCKTNHITSAMNAMNNLTVCFTFVMLCGFSRGQEYTGIQDTSVHIIYEDEGKAENSFDFFDSDELLQMILCFDIRGFLKTKNEPQYFGATLTVKLNDKDSVSQHILLKARGEMRRSYCSFPPIMLRFTDNELVTEPIQSDGKLKLVTHCKQIPVYRTYLLKEYLAYKLYNLVTPFSFKVRLVKINYVDIGRSGKAFTAFGFLIEDEEHMAERNHATLVSNMNVLQLLGSSIGMARVAVFNYMIGNTDWSLDSEHNVRILTTPEKPPLQATPVAYDFDYSGLVNTEYAVPHEGLPVRTVRERFYKGHCFNNDELEPVMEEFDALKDNFVRTIQDFEYLSNGHKKDIQSYIEGFYKTYRHSYFVMYDLSCASHSE